MQYRDRSRIKCLDHHLLLASIIHKQIATVKDQLHRADDLVKATCGTAFLREPNDAQRLLIPVLDYRHHFSRKGNLSQI
jgi:hypothetical protein